MLVQPHEPVRADVGVVEHDDVIVPPPGEEVAAALVVPPARDLERAPRPASDLFVCREQQEVRPQLLDLRVGLLVRGTPQVHGRAHAAALRLAFVEQDRSRERQQRDRSGAKAREREDGGRPRLVVVLEEAHEPRLPAGVGP